MNLTRKKCASCGEYTLVPGKGELRRVRKMRNLTLAFVARKLGYSVVHVSDIERGNRSARQAVVRFYTDLEFPPIRPEEGP